jgi:hypothetical protein
VVLSLLSTEDRINDLPGRSTGRAVLSLDRRNTVSRLFTCRARAALVAAGIAVAITAGAATSAFAATPDIVSATSSTGGSATLTPVAPGGRTTDPYIVVSPPSSA